MADSLSPIRQEMAFSDVPDMTQESVGTSVMFINTETAIFSETARRTARSHAASVSRQRGTATRRKLRSRRDDQPVNGESSKADESVVLGPTETTFSVAIRESPDAITPNANPSPKTFLDTALFDPFATTALRMDRKMTGLLKGCKLRYPLH